MEVAKTIATYRVCEAGTIPETVPLLSTATVAGFLKENPP
jgi:hypothetical protein